MIRLYFYEGSYGHGAESYPLIREAAAQFLMEVGSAPGKYPEEIAVADNGKPYFTDSDLHFSVSNSEDMWVCAVADSEIGIDLQTIGQRNYAAIAARHYGPNEQKYVEWYGEEGFFEIWVRHEAIGKYFGTGIFGALPDVVSEENTLLTRMGFGGKKLVVKGVELSPEVKCAVCTELEEEIGIRLLG